MLKCDLKDLDIIADEEARWGGYISQLDFYVSLLTNYDDLESANRRVYTIRFRASGNKGAFKSLSEMHLKCSKNFESTYKYFAKYLCPEIVENYGKVKEMYPDFDKFLELITDTPSLAGYELGFGVKRTNPLCYQKDDVSAIH